MLNRRSGFTLIELLIVIVIIGILAAIAIPKFGKTREKAYFRAMKTDLRNLVGHQEAYWAVAAPSFQYAPSMANLPDFTTSRGVTVDISVSGVTGFGATAAHAALAANQTCAIYMGRVAAVPAPALTPGIVFCTNDD
jgi:prepilin-type N-terminal cleavage/methylation domain-containing protein